MHAFSNVSQSLWENTEFLKLKRYICKNVSKKKLVDSCRVSIFHLDNIFIFFIAKENL